MDGDDFPTSGDDEPVTFTRKDAACLAVTCSAQKTMQGRMEEIHTDICKKIDDLTAAREKQDEKVGKAIKDLGEGLNTKIETFHDAMKCQKKECEKRIGVLETFKTQITTVLLTINGILALALAILAVMRFFLPGGG
jgi:hypothetical protein